MFTSIDKAIVAALGSLVYFLGFFGIVEVNEGLVAPVAAVLTPLAVWFVSNKD